MGMVPRSVAALSFSGKSIERELKGKTSRFSYTDPDGGASDSFSITLADTEGDWRGPWYPKKGDRIDVALLLLFWNGELSPPQQITCGSFTLDKVGLNSRTATLGGVSKPACKDFSAKDRTKTWSGVTLEQIAQEIANTASLTLHFDAESVSIEREEQDGPDADFLKSLCERYGLKMKIYRDKLVIFDRAVYKKKPPVMTFSAANRELSEDWDYDDSLEPYTGVELAYTNADGKKTTFKHGDDERVLFINQKADNDSDAERIAMAKLEQENHGCTTISFTTRARSGLCASQTIRVQGTGRRGKESRADGVYYVESLEIHRDNEGLLMTINGVKVETEGGA